MAMVINTNMASLNATRILGTTQSEQSTAMERLTSGLRINKSADDAAGLAVATGMTTQIMGTTQAIRNANDGMGMMKTMDGASEEVVNMLQRMRVLGLQSLNGTYSSSNRDQMNAEFHQLQSEIGRIADTTKFNGQYVMTQVEDGFSAMTTKQVHTNAKNGFADVSGLVLHIGWETSSVNKIKVGLMDFNTLSVLGGSVDGERKVINGATQAEALKNAASAIAAIDADLSAIKTMKSYWGAMQNRLEYTVSNLANVNENIMDARMGILDADYAVESANLARTQVLQQAGMSMLSQANQQAMNVLQLLQ